MERKKEVSRPLKRTYFFEVRKELMLQFTELMNMFPRERRDVSVFIQKAYWHQQRGAVLDGTLHARLPQVNHGLRYFQACQGVPLKCHLLTNSATV